ncbi:MAG: 2Fe-2S iron-sulfur cluster binding domain-containing protein, partial [Spirochaetaceae bacterium]|nr:2Fe-2S iron-sulfur cluster binding domain-containing protein [Spirochaetaceae bacterium]
MPKVDFVIEGSDAVSISAEAGVSILDAAIKAGIAVDAPCGGNGTCGKCRVKLTAGAVEGAPSRHINAADTADGWILACESRLKEDVKIFVAAASLSYQSRIRITDIEGEREKAVFGELRQRLAADSFAGDHGIEAHEVELSPPSIEDAQADRERLLTGLAAACGLDEGAITLGIYAQKKLPQVLRENEFRITCIVRKSA